jgi:hypothetical protein
VNTQTTKTPPRRVRLLDNREDFQCALLGSLGFSTRFIMGKTRFSQAQVAYRLRVACVKRADYRDGGSRLSTSVLRQVAKTSIPEVVAHLRTTMTERHPRGRNASDGREAAGRDFAV